MSPATPGTAGTLSDEQLFSVFGRDPAQLAQIGALFVRQYDRLFEDLFEAVLANRAADTRLRLHSIKGMAALIGAAAAVAETAELESLVEVALSAAAPLPSAAINKAVGNLQATLLPYRTWFARWLPPASVP
jgi:HPt (histidine-containing phosphotransfer) domain-containing protein